MLVMTYHQTFLTQDASGGFAHAAFDPERRDFVTIDGEVANRIFSEGPLAGFAMLVGDQGVNFYRDGRFMCAEPVNGRVVADREACSFWERFVPIPREKSGLAASFKDIHAERDRFARRVEALRQSGSPVKLHMGCCFRCEPGFLNLDKYFLAPFFAISNTDEYFIFPYAEMAWGIPDNTVDYIYHEDFIEHIDQLTQVQFLTEALRVMKPGAVHRVNTPSFVAAYRRHSRFKEGFDGVYTGERALDHISLLSHASLKEMADMIGYSDVVFTTKDHGISPHALPDTRPFADRDAIVGNIYADLLK